MGAQPRGEKSGWNSILSIPVASPCASPQPDSRQQAAASVLNNRARFFVAVCDSRASAAIFAGQVVFKSANGSSIPTPRPMPGAATAMHMCRLHTERMGRPPVCRGQRQPLTAANTRKRRRTYAVDAAHGELGVVWRERGGRHLVGAIRGLHQRRQVLQPHGNTEVWFWLLVETPIDESTRRDGHYFLPFPCAEPSFPNWTPPWPRTPRPGATSSTLPASTRCDWEPRGAAHAKATDGHWSRAVLASVLVMLRMAHSREECLV